MYDYGYDLVWLVKCNVDGGREMERGLVGMKGVGYDWVLIIWMLMKL